MKRPLALVFLGLGLAACSTPAPRIPFEQGGSWIAFAGGGARATNDRYIQNYGPAGIEVVALNPGAGGWGWEVAARYGSDTGTDKESEAFTFFFDVDPDPDVEDVQRIDTSHAFDSERETEIYELNVGVRQVYCPGSNLQPYFGVGGSYFRINTEQHLSGTFHVVPPDPLDQEFDLSPSNPSSHFHDNSLGFYLRSGLLWRLSGDPSTRKPGLSLAADVRGMLGHEFSYLELNIGLGFGR